MFFSPTFGKLTGYEVKNHIASYFLQDKDSEYRIIVGVDSEKHSLDSYDFITALVVQRKGKGGIYFWSHEVVARKIDLKQRMYMEAIMSLQAAENLVELFKRIPLAKYEFEIHVDIGTNGKTKDLINEITGMVRASGYTVKIKPESFGASSVADRHT